MKPIPIGKDFKVSPDGKMIVKKPKRYDVSTELKKKRSQKITVSRNPRAKTG